MPRPPNTWQEVASLFAAALRKDALQRFQHVIFAIPDEQTRLDNGHGRVIGMEHTGTNHTRPSNGEVRPVRLCPDAWPGARGQRRRGCRAAAADVLRLRQAGAGVGPHGQRRGRGVPKAAVVFDCRHIKQPLKGPQRQLMGAAGSPVWACRQVWTRGCGRRSWRGRRHKTSWPRQGVGGFRWICWPDSGADSGLEAGQRGCGLQPGEAQKRHLL